MRRILRTFLLALALLNACAPTQPASAPAGQAEEHHHGSHSGHEKSHRFQHAGEWARVFDDPARDAWQKPDLVVDAMKLSAGMTVADVGAGTGYFLPHLSRAVGPQGRVIGVDIEPDMVRYMSERAQRESLTNVGAALASPDDPALGDNSVDRILIVDTWHHIDNRPAYAAKLARALRPGGMVFIVDFTLSSEHGPPKQERLPPSAVADELTRGGFLAEPISVALPDQYVVAGRVKR